MYLGTATADAGSDAAGGAETRRSLVTGGEGAAQPKTMEQFLTAATKDVDRLLLVEPIYQLLELVKEPRVDPGALRDFLRRRRDRYRDRMFVGARLLQGLKLAVQQPLRHEVVGSL